MTMTQTPWFTEEGSEFTQEQSEAEPSSKSRICASLSEFILQEGGLQDGYDPHSPISFKILHSIKIS